MRVEKCRVLRLQVVAEERSLGTYLELYTRCLEAENSTLMRKATPETAFDPS